VLEHGTGALNIDGCRIAGTSGKRNGGSPFVGSEETYAQDGTTRGMVRSAYETPAPGRWPANVVLDEAAAAELDRQSGTLAAGNHPANRAGLGSSRTLPSSSLGTAGERRATDPGGAARFFYCAKTSRGERNAGLDGFERTLEAGTWGGAEHDLTLGKGAAIPRANVHPTVKPIALMRWLCRLVTLPGGLILDPFAGSGTTGCAAVLEGFDFIGLEREPEYVEIARARVAHWLKHKPAEQLGLDVG